VIGTAGRIARRAGGGFSSLDAEPGCGERGLKEKEGGDGDAVVEIGGGLQHPDSTRHRLRGEKGSHSGLYKPTHLHKVTREGYTPSISPIQFIHQ